MDQDALERVLMLKDNILMRKVEVESVEHSAVYTSLI